MTDPSFNYRDQTLTVAEQIGVLLISGDHQGAANIMTISWLLLGRSYYDRPIAVVAVRPATYTFHLLDAVEEFVIAVPSLDLSDAVALCGEQSGRDIDKFAATSLTPLPSKYVAPPSIQECVINIECRIYHKQQPPHQILTPHHRQRPLAEQHTIYFAEILNITTGPTSTPAASPDT